MTKLQDFFPTKRTGIPYFGPTNTNLTKNYQKTLQWSTSVYIPGALVLTFYPRAFDLPGSTMVYRVLGKADGVLGWMTVAKLTFIYMACPDAVTIFGNASKVTNT